MLKLLIGGSPCTYWSIAQSKHRETEPSGLGWELFKNYLIAKDKYNPDYFLYENNYSMDNKIRDEITKQLGVEPIMINSALVSAQSRKRLYWTNIPNVQQPEDKGIMLNDILESGENLSADIKSYCLTASYNGACGWNTLERKQRTMVAESVCEQEQLHNRCADCNGNNDRRYEARTDNKSGTITTTNRQVAIAQPVCVAQRGRYTESGSRSKKIENSDTEQYYEARTDGKTNTPTTVLKDNAVAEPVKVGTLSKYQGDRIHSSEGKATTLTSSSANKGGNSGLYAIPVNCNTCYTGTYGAAKPLKIWNNGKGQRYGVYSTEQKTPTVTTNYKASKFATPLSCSKNSNSLKIYEVRDGNITINGKTYPIKLADGFYIIRLLTVIECKRLQTVPDNYIMPCSKSQNYKMLGNGWTIDVIAHILSHIPEIKIKNVEVLSMYDGMSCGHIALDKLGCNVVNYYATEIDKYAIKTTFANYPDTIYLGDAFNVRKDNFKIEPPKVNKQEISAVSGNQLTLF